MGIDRESLDHALQQAAFPLAAVVGSNHAKLALLALAVDPGLRGVAIAGGPGVGKSLLARSFLSLLAGGSSDQRALLEIPLGVTEDRLLGGLCWERALAAGERRAARGLLAQANGGFLYADEINLLEPKVAHIVVSALNTGAVRVEREGVGIGFESRFALIGTYDPAEGELGPPLQDALGLHVRQSSPPWEQRTELMRRVEAHDRDPAQFCEIFATETARLGRRVREARGRLHTVRLAKEDRRRLSLAAMALGVEGHRVDIFASRFACVHAALHGRTSVEETDLEIAVRWVLIPRGTVSGAARAASSRRLHDQTGSAPPQPDAGGGSAPESVRDLVLKAAACEVQAGLLDVPLSLGERGGAGNRGRKGSVATDSERGRFVRAVTLRPPAGRLAMEATLRAAAPQQGRRLASAPEGSRRTAIQIAAHDLRFKQFRQKAGVLLIFAVDASGSMALNRVDQAKGAMLRLLREAYVRRDKIALVGFRGARAEILLPPSRGVERARRAVDAMPVGGGTPLAAGIRAAAELARRAGLTGTRQSVLVLLTDGQANVAGPGTGTTESVWQELERDCLAARACLQASVVIDTRQRHVSSGEARRIAELLGGKYVYLARPGPDDVYTVVAGMAETARRRPHSSSRGIGSGERD